MKLARSYIVRRAKAKACLSYKQINGRQPCYITTTTGIALSLFYDYPHHPKNISVYRIQAF